MDEKINEMIAGIGRQLNPVSMFLYGSRARGDHYEGSDYEIGVLYSRDKKISRTEIRNLNTLDNAYFYPFEYEGFLNYNIDTPFTENIYFRDIIGMGKTVFGKNVVENFKSPSINTLDLLSEVRFESGLALASVFSFRRNDIVTSKEEFSKSCLFGLRCLIILETKQFPYSFEQIYKSFSLLEIDEYKDLIDNAFEIRKGGEIQESDLYRNISFLNRIVKRKILEKVRSEGNSDLIS